VKVSIYKLEDGDMAALVEATPGSRMSPVMVQGITPENVVSKVLPEVVALRRPKTPRPLPPG